MKWRDIIIGAVASLLVTLLGGVGVFYATKESDDKKVEKLIYSLNQNAVFSGGSQDFTFSSIELTNNGGVAAKNVIILISLKDSEIRDLAINAGEGLKEIAREQASKSVRIVYAILLPQERVTINLILTKPESANVDIRSDSSLGEELAYPISKNDSNTSKINSIAQKVVPATGILSALVMTLGFTFLRRRGLLDLRNEKNNTGFLLLHNGITDEATLIFSSAIREGRCDPFTLSNYALCKAVQGEFEQADKLIMAASFRERAGHAKGVILFNKALIKLLQGDKDNSINLLKEALSVSRKEILLYCQKSTVLDSVRSEPAFFELFKKK